VAHASSTLDQLRRWGVGLRSYSEPWLDTSGTSPSGELMFNILASFAQFERALIAERVRAGMAGAKGQGKHVGRPRAINGEWEEIAPRVRSGRTIAPSSGEGPWGKPHVGPALPQRTRQPMSAIRRPPQFSEMHQPQHRADW
jgi:hypothetical protein